MLLGRGDGTFLPPLNSAVGGVPSGVAAGDFNGDGWLDAAAANPTRTTSRSSSTTGPGPARRPVDHHQRRDRHRGEHGTVERHLHGEPLGRLQPGGDGPIRHGRRHRRRRQRLPGGLADVDLRPRPDDKTVTVLGQRRPARRATETFSVRLSDSTNAFLADATGVGTIVDDEPTVSITDDSSSHRGEHRHDGLHLHRDAGGRLRRPGDRRLLTADLTEEERYWYGPAGHGRHRLTRPPPAR